MRNCWINSGWGARELQKRADAGNPLYEDDGSYMQLGDGYKVTYDNVTEKSN